MRAGLTRTAATLACAAFAAALALAGCAGAGGDSTATTTARQTTTGAQGPKPADNGMSRDSGSQPSTTPQPITSPSKGGNVGSKAATPGVPIAKGSDNSIQTFGLEASGSERARATAIARAYLGARASKRWVVACSYLAGPLKGQLEALLPRAPSAKAKGCAAAIEAISTGVPASVLRKGATVHVLSLRVKGPRAFLIYRGGGGGTPLALPMAREGGAWKVGALAANPLSL